MVDWGDGVMAGWGDGNTLHMGVGMIKLRE